MFKLNNVKKFYFDPIFSPFLILVIGTLGVITLLILLYLLTLYSSRAMDIREDMRNDFIRTDVRTIFEDAIITSGNALTDFSELLHVDSFSPEDAEVILDYLSGSNDETFKKRFNGKDMASLLSFEVDEGSIDFEEVNKKFIYFREEYGKEIANLRVLLNTEPKEEIFNDEFHLTYAGKKYVGLDAYRVVEDLIDGRLP